MDLSKKYRHEDNPKEDEFYNKFVDQYDDNLDFHISRIVFPSLDGDKPVSYVNVKERQIVLNTIQWLGSPVGQSFLNDCGFVLKEEK